MTTCDVKDFACSNEHTENDHRLGSSSALLSFLVSFSSNTPTIHSLLSSKQQTDSQQLAGEHNEALAAKRAGYLPQELVEAKTGATLRVN